MTVLKDVENLVTRISPSAICDDCITERLDLTVRQHPNHKTRELAVISKKVVHPLPWGEAGHAGVGSLTVIGVGPGADRL
ncbi:hypothetical protein E2493_02670 [Sphingomonas parva]|uniref:Uncharacterized protein n=1 Tax=Sphingomonas parva TaxID=2555898 RepID=A0A4Y8ZUR9_9SPHN|nr:hypothetical protein E2493_02670 [Sphingomonas parva]